MAPTEQQPASQNRNGTTANVNYPVDEIIYHAYREGSISPSLIPNPSLSPYTSEGKVDAQDAPLANHEVTLPISPSALVACSNRDLTSSGHSSSTPRLLDKPIHEFDALVTLKALIWKRRGGTSLGNRLKGSARWKRRLVALRGSRLEYFKVIGLYDVESDSSEEEAEEEAHHNCQHHHVGPDGKNGGKTKRMMKNALCQAKDLAKGIYPGDP